MGNTLRRGSLAGRSCDYGAGSRIVRAHHSFGAARRSRGIWSTSRVWSGCRGSQTFSAPTPASLIGSTEDAELYFYSCGFHCKLNRLRWEAITPPIAAAKAHAGVPGQRPMEKTTVLRDAERSPVE